MSVYALNYLSNYDPDDFCRRVEHKPMTKTITFVKFHGREHPKTGEPLVRGVDYFAVPGGGVATRSQIHSWGLRTRTVVVLAEDI